MGLENRGLMGKQQQTALITGGTDGLGRAAALRLAEKGYRVFAAGRSAEKRTAIDRIAASKKLPMKSLEMDVREDSSVTRAIEAVLAETGSVDVLVNNAGIGMMAVVEELRADDLRTVYETNVFGVLRVTQAVLPHMRERRKGRILMLSSVAGIVTPPLYAAYSSSKHALEAISNALRLEMFPFHIEVVLIEPGYIVTNFRNVVQEMARSYVDGSSASPYAKIYASAIAGASDSRQASKTTPEDCAEVILHAIEASHPKARYPVTPLAKWVAFGRRMLPDTLLDSFLRRRFGIAREEED